MEKGAEVDELKKPSFSEKRKADRLPIAQAFLKIISAQIEVKEDETKFSKQIQGKFQFIFEINYLCGLHFTWGFFTAS